MKKYIIRLDGIEIGYSYLEDADPPMGVVRGKIIFKDIESPYEFISTYCKENKVPINEDDPEYEAIFTQSIESLKVYSETGAEIKGVGALIEGMTEEGFEIDIFGIPYPFYGEEFRHHREKYDKETK